MSYAAPSPALGELATRHGVATEFWDWKGTRTEVSRDTLVAVLSGLGVPAGDDDEIEAALAESELRGWRDALPPTVVVRVGAAPWVPVHVPHGATVTVTLELEDGTLREVSQVDHWVEPREVEGVLTGEATFAIPDDLPPGWHLLHADTDGRRHTATLIVSPGRLELPEALADGRVWGVTTQAYQVRSHGSWGVGDLADLAGLAEWAGRDLGADFVLVNPMNAAEPVAPLEPSPYLPSSRRFANPLFIRVEDTPEYVVAPAGARTRILDLAGRARRLNEGDIIDRDAVWEHKLAALEALYAVARMADDFTSWRERQGQALADFAVWCTAVERGEEPPEDDQEAAEFRRTHARRIRFHAWLQWLLARQLADAHGTALTAGMRLGVIHDLPVGVHPAGADAWVLRDAMVPGVSVGAPPDQFNQRGQDWSQPPWHPRALAEQGYAPFRDMVRHLFASSGGVRIDHVIGLFRLWWIPRGALPSEGTYVRYDHEALLSILVLEASRVDAVVIGEDLGVVEPAVRDYLRDRGVLGTSILFFEWEGGEPLPPEDYRELCLASVTTHDLPPTAGYLALAHVDLRERLGLLSRPVEEERADEVATLDRIRSALVKRGLLESTAGDQDVADQVVALHRYLAMTPARMLGVALADLVQDSRIINQPGTDEEYPNWRFPLAGPDGSPVSLEGLRTLAFPKVLAATLTDRTGPGRASRPEYGAGPPWSGQVDQTR